MNVKQLIQGFNSKEAFYLKWKRGMLKRHKHMPALSDVLTNQTVPPYLAYISPRGKAEP